MATLEQAFGLAAAQFQAGDLTTARSVCMQILTQLPDQADTLHLLGVIEHKQGNLVDARRLIQRAIRNQETNASFHMTLGLIQKSLGRLQEAVDAYREAVRIDDQFAEALCNLGNALWEQGDMVEAEKVCRRAVELRPQLTQAQNNLGNALKALGRGDEAITHYREALRLRPNDLEVARNLGNLLLTTGRHEEAIPILETVARLDAKNPKAHNSLGQALSNAGRILEAHQCFERAVSLDPANPDALVSLGNAYKDQGQAMRAIEHYQRALQIEPDHAIATENMLFTLGYLPDADPMQVLAQHVTHGRKMIRAATRPRQHDNDRSADRVLRVGYVSPDFCNHAVACFFLPIIAEHDDAAVETFCYAQVANPDNTTAQIQKYAKHWRNICGMRDEGVAKQIQHDRIDILVDLAGYTQGNRLPVFARKPAPVQVSYLGYGFSTGLETIDYRFTDTILDPPEAPPEVSNPYVETLVRLEGSFLCYAPPRYAATEVTLSPAVTAGFVTFGSLTNPAKLNPQVFDLWAQVLRATPKSRLLLSRDSFRGAMRERLMTEFKRRNIDPSRLMIESDLPPGKRRIQMYDRIDIALDTFPYSGATTTCEGLWMGVPTVTLRGRTMVSRMAASVLNRVGLPDLVADTPEAYVAAACSLASDLETLAHLRSGLRDRLIASPLCDAKSFTRGVEAAYRQMWRQWVSP